MSIDAPLGDVDGPDLTGLIPDDRQAPARQAVAAALVEQVAAYVQDLDLDRIDQAIAEDLFTLCDDSWYQRDTRVARDFGVTQEIIRRRRIRLQERIRSWTEAAA